MDIIEQSGSPKQNAAKKRIAPLVVVAIGALVTCLMDGCRQESKQFMNLDGKKPPGYTQIVTTPPGRTIYLSGMGGRTAEGTLPKDFPTQADNTFKNIGRALKLAGADFKDIVKINYYVTDMKSTQSLRDVRAKYLNMDAPPAATLVQAGLGGDAMIEIECVAVVPE